MKKLKEKSERLLLGKIIEAEAESKNPDMKLVRECTDKIEATAGKLTDSEIEAKLAKITGAKKTAATHVRFKKRKLWVSAVAASLAVVMVTAAARAVLHAVGVVVKVNHFVKHGSNYILYRAVESTCAYVQFVAVVGFAARPYFGYRNVSVGAGGALDGNDGF